MREKLRKRTGLLACLLYTSLFLNIIHLKWNNRNNSVYNFHFRFDSSQSSFLIQHIIFRIIFPFSHRQMQYVIFIISFFIRWNYQRKKPVSYTHLEAEGVAMFPDAPSLRALKHVEELITARENGYEAGILFVVQMEGIRYFTPNRQAQPAFARALERAEAAGVGLYAYGCHVTRDSMQISYEIPVILNPDKEQDRLETIAAPLLKWYDENRRVLPWREDPAPYRVWISEIMLQQTRVEAVKPYFQRFMESLPDIAALADVPEDRLLKLWEGLGYYNRARNLKKAAGVIMAEYAGVMPAETEELLKLPGIGSYTAGAVASIAYGEPVPAVDGNVLRVISRYRMDDRDIDVYKRQVWSNIKGKQR